MFPLLLAESALDNLQSTFLFRTFVGPTEHTEFYGCNVCLICLNIFARDINVI